MKSLGISLLTTLTICGVQALFAFADVTLTSECFD